MRFIYYYKGCDMRKQYLVQMICMYFAPFITIDTLDASLHPELSGKSVLTTIILSELFNSEFDYKKLNFKLRWSFE
jgi:hypothetical protein